MNELALFAGAGGGQLGGKLLGWRTVCAVEIEPYCRRILCDRQDDGTFDPFPIWDDIKTFDGRPWRGIVDVVSGGFPCQPYSTASRGRKTAKCLAGQMLRVIGECKPEFVFSENVQRKPIESMAAELRRMGYKTRAIALSAKDLGADHIRARYWLLGYTDNQRQPVRQIHAEMAIEPSFNTSVWEDYPRESRMADGLATRTHRFKAIGNGQVPAVAATAWSILNGAK